MSLDRHYAALLIGANYENDKDSALSGCLNDVDNVKNLLVNVFKWNDRDITVLKEEQATKANILNELTRFIQNANSHLQLNPSARIDLWLHYSGHGSQLSSSSPGEADRQDETIVPYDYQTSGQITDSEIANIMRHLNNNIHLTCVFDCCHSGTIMDLPYIISDMSISSCTYKQERSGSRCRWNSSSNIVCLSGCRDKQTSADYDGAGAMTTALLLVLKDHKYSLSIRTLMRDLRVALASDRLIKRGFKQIAQFSSNKMIDQDTMFVCKDSRLRGEKTEVVVDCTFHSC